MLSFLVVVAVIARMLKAVRLLDGRVTLLQEQLEHSHLEMLMAPATKARARAPSARTPIESVPSSAASAASPRTPAPVRIDGKSSEEWRAPGEATTHTIEESEAEEIWEHMAAEQARMKKAMGRDFQVRPAKRSAAEIRGKPAVRSLSASELARKLERK
jgi:hypothetical protein